MARPLRIEYAGACYHIMNRGNRRENVFVKNADFLLFIRKLYQFSTIFKVNVFAYCLMDNHFHLYAQTAEANLSRFMQSFLTSFTLLINRRDKKAGHLFQGRFKAILVEHEQYGLELVRYIHLNPVRTASLRKTGVSHRRKVLRQYPWSSYRSLIGLKRNPHWLKKKEIILSFGETIKKGELQFAQFVEEGLLRDIEDPFALVAGQNILGSDSFVDRIRRRYVQVSDDVNIRREQGQAAVLRNWVDLSELITAVSIEYQVERDYLLQKHSKNNEARQVLQYLSCFYCRGRYSLTELGKQLGPVSVGCLTRTRYNVANKLKSDKSLKKRIRAIEKKLGISQ